MSRTFWVSVNGGVGGYVEAEDFADAAKQATFMHGGAVTVTIEDHTEEEACPT